MNDVTEHDEPGRSSPTPAAADISDEMLDEAEKLLGVWLRRDVHWPTQAEAVTDDRIRRWSMYSVGDDNPLYMQPDYAGRTIWGTTIAPPSFLYTVDSTIVAPGFRGIQWVYGGTRWTHYRPVRSGDVISARARLIRITEKKGAHVPRFFSQTGETLYTNQRGELVCRT
jgi:acyl dehydratase